MKEHMKKVLKEMGISFNDSNLEKIYNHLQKNGDIDKYYKCTRKSKCTTIFVATKHAYEMEQFRRGKQYFPYKCKYCGFYHVGSRKEGKTYDDDLHQ